MKLIYRLFLVVLLIIIFPFSLHGEIIDVGVDGYVVEIVAEYGEWIVASVTDEFTGLTGTSLFTVGGEFGDITFLKDCIAVNFDDEKRYGPVVFFGSSLFSVGNHPVFALSLPLLTSS